MYIRIYRPDGWTYSVCFVLRIRLPHLLCWLVVSWLTVFFWLDSSVLAWFALQGFRLLFGVSLACYVDCYSLATSVSCARFVVFAINAVRFAGCFTLRFFLCDPDIGSVSLLNQEVIVERIQSMVEMKLRNFSEASTYQEQTGDPSPVSSISASKGSPINISTSGSQKVPVNKMVRTDSQDPSGRLHAYLQIKPSSHRESNSGLNFLRSSIRQRRNPKETADLTSIQELIDEFESGCHSGLLDIVRNCTFVGMADDVFALLQHNTHLYLANVVDLSKELLYQLVLRRFGYFNAIQLSDPAPLQELLMLALREEDPDPEGNEKDDLKEKIAEMNAGILKQKAEMLDEYFGIHVDPQGNLSRLPVILDQHTPDMDRVPEFVLCLGNDVDWDDEKVCFQTIAAALGNFYAMHPPLLPNPSGDGLEFYNRGCCDAAEGKGSVSEGDAKVDEGVAHELLAEAQNAWAQREWSIQHVLFPSMRLFFKPPTSMATNGTFVQVASLEKLYRVFERC